MWKFAEDFAAYLGSEFAVPVASGTAALHLALKVLGVDSLDQVLVSSLTFIASVNPICYCGAEPVFLDSEISTFNMDPAKAIAKIHAMLKKTKAIIIPHIYGHAADLDPLLEVCKQYGIKVIEDASEALGTKYKGQYVGTFGDIGCFSFNGNKLITTGGGGMLVTDCQEWADQAKYYSTQAKDDPVQFIHHEIGYNYRLTNIQAAMGVAQLKHIDEFILKKREIAHSYRQGLKDIPGLTLNPEINWCDNSFWLYSILIEEKEFGMDSKQFYRRLNEQNIQSRPFFKPIHTMPMFEQCDRTDLSGAQWLWERGVNLPSSVGLTDQDLDRVIQTIRSYEVLILISGTRAEYGLLYWIIREIQADPELQLQLIATGMNLSQEFGLTYKQIEENGFQIDRKVEILLSSDTEVGVTKSVGIGCIGFADAFADLQPDLISNIPFNTYYDMTTLIDEVLKNHGKVGCFPIYEYWMDIGQHEDFQKAHVDYFEYFSSKECVK